MVIYWLKKVWLNGFDQKSKQGKTKKNKEKRWTKKPPKQSAFLNVKVNDDQNVWNMQKRKFIF